MPRPGHGGHSPPPTRRTTALVVESELEGDEPVRASSFTIESPSPNSAMLTRRASSFRATAPSLETPPYKAGWTEVDVDPGAAARPPVVVVDPNDSDLSGEIWGPRGQPGRKDDPSSNLNRAMVYYPATSRGLDAPIAEGRFPIIGFAHGHRLPWGGVGGGVAEIDADPLDFTQDYRQWAGMLRYLSGWGFIVVSPDLHWIIVDGRSGAADVPRRGSSVGAAMEYLRQEEPFANSVRYGGWWRSGPYGLLGHSQGGSAVWNFARSLKDSPPVAVGLLSPNPASLGDRGGWAYPVLLIMGELDYFVQTTPDFYDELAGVKVFAQITGGNHWGYLDSLLLGDYRDAYPAVLDDAPLPEQQVAQRLLATHFVTTFFRKYVRDEPGIPRDLEPDEVLDRLPGTSVEVSTGD